MPTRAKQNWKSVAREELDATKEKYQVFFFFFFLSEIQTLNLTPLLSNKSASFDQVCLYSVYIREYMLWWTSAVHSNFFWAVFPVIYSYLVIFKLLWWLFLILKLLSQIFR